jgi:hypothetical protein
MPGPQGLGASPGFRNDPPVCPGSKPLPTATTLLPQDAAAASEAVASLRCRQKATPARPEAGRFSRFKRGITPAVGPFLPLRDSPARASLRTPGTKARHAFPPGPCPAVIPVSNAALWRGRSIRHQAWTWSSVRGMTGSRGRPRARRACSVERRASGVECPRRAARSGGTAAGRPSAWSAAARGAGAAGRNLPRGAVSRRRWPTALERPRDGGNPPVWGMPPRALVRAADPAGVARRADRRQRGPERGGSMP